MIALLQRTGFRVEELFQALVFFVIFLLPVARGILASRRKRAEAEAARRGGASTTQEPDVPERAGGESGAPGEPAEGRQLWEQLLRGELPQAETEAPEVPRAPTPVPDRPRPARRAQPAEPAPEPVFGGFEDIVLENELENTGPRTISTEHAPVSSAPLGSRLPSRQLQPTITPSGSELASDAARIVGLPTVDLTAASYNPYGSAGAVSRDEATGRSHRALRQAVVWSEILAPPVSLRGPGKGPAGPPGL